MKEIRFKGRVVPEFSELSISEPIKLVHVTAPTPEKPSGFVTKMVISLNKSAIDVACSVQPWDDSMLPVLYKRALEQVRAVVDLSCFASGRSLHVVLDGFVQANGTLRGMWIETKELRPLCTVAKTGPKLDDVDLEEALQNILKEPLLFLAMRDLINSLANPNTAVVDCARAVEGLGNILTPDSPNRTQGWSVFQDQLNIDSGYRELITRTATGPSHKGRVHIQESVRAEIQSRSWTIMNRFLEYRRRGNQQLPLTEFPMLR